MNQEMNVFNRFVYIISDTDNILEIEFPVDILFYI